MILHCHAWQAIRCFVACNVAPEPWSTGLSASRLNPQSRESASKLSATRNMEETAPAVAPNPLEGPIGNNKPHRFKGDQSLQPEPAKSPTETPWHPALPAQTGSFPAQTGLACTSFGFYIQTNRAWEILALTSMEASMKLPTSRQVEKDPAPRCFDILYCSMWQAFA